MTDRCDASGDQRRNQEPFVWPLQELLSARQQAGSDNVDCCCNIADVPLVKEAATEAPLGPSAGTVL